jgi:hypothetical protein
MYPVSAEDGPRHRSDWVIRAVYETGYVVECSACEQHALGYFLNPLDDYRSFIAGPIRYELIRVEREGA